MSTTNKQTQQNQYDPSSMNAFTGMTGPMSQAVQGYINNPFGNPFFQQQQQMGTNQANMMGQSAMSNMTRNLGMSGMSQNSPAALEMMNNQMRQNSSNRANLGFLAPMQQAQGMQQNAINTAAGYHPLQTGGTQTQSQTGMGQFASLLGAGLGLATGGMSKGLGGMFGGGQAQSAGQVNDVWGSGAMTNMPSGYGNYGSGASMGQNAPDYSGYNYGGNYGGPSPFMMGQPQQPQGY